MNMLIKSLRWFDDHILKILVFGYIIIIPLLFKLPFTNVEYTYIHLRYEDLYVLLVAIVYLIQFARRRVVIPRKYAILFGLFWLSMFISFAYGYWIQKTIVIQQLGILFALRRIEYMLIFFVVYTTTKTKKDFLQYVGLAFFVLAMVSVYGYGQKLLGFPAVQTMNPEYSRGHILVLDPAVRISSTFAGHYDLSAYIIFLMPILLGFYLWTKNKLYFMLFILSLGTLILAAARSSYLAYLGTIILFLVYIRRFKLLILVLLVTAMLTPLSDNLKTRFLSTFQPTSIFIDSLTGEVLVPKETMDPNVLPPGDFGAGARVDKTKITPVAKPKVDKKTEALAKKQLRESLLAEAAKTGTKLTDLELSKLVDQLFNRQITIQEYLVDISLSTRFQVEWPRAINALKKNLILGTGPSSLGEATDNNFLRWLGEFGLLGTSLLIAIMSQVVKRVWMKIKTVDKNESYIYFGFLFGMLGLIINATYIDVFDASKVGYTFWLFMGAFAVIADMKEKGNSKVKK